MERKLEASGRKLCNPLTLIWTRLGVEEEALVLSLLKRIFEKNKGCMRTVKKPPKWDKDKPVDSLTEKELKEKNLFKSCFVIGANEVIRSLEKDELCLVIRTSNMQNMVASAILSLATSCHCPAVCVSDLHLAIQASWPGLTAVSVFGVKRMSEPNDFRELVQYVRSVLPVPATPSEEKKVEGNASKQESEKGEVSIKMSNKGDNSDIVTADSSKVNTETARTTSSPSCHTNSQSSVKSVVVDPTKYYVYKSQSSSTKTFGDQDFIAFGGEKAEDIEIYIGNGKTIDRFIDILHQDLYGIAPVLSVDYNAKISKRPESRKRPLEDSSSYKGITIKQAKRDTTSARQINKEQRRLKKQQKKQKKIKKLKKT